MGAVLCCPGKSGTTTTWRKRHGGVAMTEHRDTRTIAVAAVVTGLVAGLAVLSSSAAPLGGSPWDTPPAAGRHVDETAANGPGRA
jgi:hypothetical protein